MMARSTKSTAAVLNDAGEMNNLVLLLPLTAQAEGKLEQADWYGCRGWGMP
jgi:hypothetical protein